MKFNCYSKWPYNVVAFLTRSIDLKSTVFLLFTTFLQFEVSDMKKEQRQLATTVATSLLMGCGTWP